MLAFFSTTPLASFLGSLPLLTQEGNFAGRVIAGPSRCVIIDIFREES